jgi:hypothetical protein
VPPSPDQSPRHASDRRFREGRVALAASLRALLGRHAPEPLDDADRAAAIAAEARAAHRAAAEHAWGVVRHAWAAGDRAGVAAVLHAVRALVGARPVWLVVPGREPQAAPLDAEAALDNPLGFAALAEGGELLLLDQELPAGLWLGGAAEDGWEVEAWGAEPWLSAATRAVREWRAGGAGA